MTALHRHDLSEALHRREIHLRDGIPSALIADAIDDAKLRRGRVLRAVYVRLRRAMPRLFGRQELGRCGCGPSTASLNA